MLLKKQFIPLIILFALLLPGRLLSQVFSTTVNPSGFCYNTGSNTGQAMVASPVAGAGITYSWSIISPSGSVSFTVAQATGSLINVTYNGCGTFTLTCSAYSNNVLADQAISTVSISCLSISPASQTVCLPAMITLTASGASSYTWGPNFVNSNTISQLIMSPGTITYSVMGDSDPCLATATVSAISPSITVSNASLCPGSTTTLTAFGAGTYSWTGTGIMSPATQPSIVVGPGTYTLASPATGGACMATTTISALPPLNIQITQTDYTTCLNSNTPAMTKPVTLTAYGASSYSWSPVPFPPVAPALSVTVRPLASTCYTVRGFTAICSGSAVACVTVMPQFTVSIAKPNVLTICRFDSLTVSVADISTLAVGPPASFTYSWSFSSPPWVMSSALSPTITFYPLLTTSYSVEVMDALNCISAPATGYIQVVPSCPKVGIAEQSATDRSLILYPNPAKNILFLEATSTLPAGIFVEARDVTGRVVLSAQPQLSGSDNRYELRLEELKPGLYHLSIRSEQKLLQINKFVKTD